MSTREQSCIALKDRQLMCLSPNCGTDSCWFYKKGDDTYCHYLSDHGWECHNVLARRYFLCEMASFCDEQLRSDAAWHKLWRKR